MYGEFDPGLVSLLLENDETRSDPPAFLWFEATLAVVSAGFVMVLLVV
ncbi:MAG TPA: hypothetical protein VGC40_07280 [Paenirhodobacter sp.]